MEYLLKIVSEWSFKSGGLTLQLHCEASFTVHEILLLLAR